MSRDRRCHDDDSEIKLQLAWCNCRPTSVCVPHLFLTSVWNYS